MISPIRTLQVGAFALLSVAVSAMPFRADAHDLIAVPPTPSASADETGDATIACPLDGESTFIDSWGAARSGGRRHEGVDMIAPRGTPIVAAEAGDAVFKRNRLGGNAVWITTEEGDKFYYAHLQRFEGDSRAVARGEVIGYVGSTGNARGPHLHFETHFGGSVGNPYDSAFAACVQPVIDALDALDAIRRGAEFDPLPGEIDATIIAVRVENDDFFSEEGFLPR